MHRFIISGASQAPRRRWLPVLAVLALTAAQAARAGDERPSATRMPQGSFVLHSGSKCLEINEQQLRVDGARVQIGACDGRANQVWQFERGQIVSAASGRCLDVHAPDIGVNGGRVQVADCHGGANQSWHFDGPAVVAEIDGRCLDVYQPAMERDGGHVITWSCHGRINQRWSVEPVAAMAPPRYAAPPVTHSAVRDIEAGPIWNNADADQKCPGVCAPGKWTGQWRTTVQGRMSVCGCAQTGGWQARPREEGDNRRAMGDGRFDVLLQAVKDAGFPQEKIGVVASAARDNLFTIAQLKQLVQMLTFPSDKIRMVEVVAPRVVDRQNAYSLYGAFDFDSEKEQVRAIFDRLQ